MFTEVLGLRETQYHELSFSEVDRYALDLNEKTKNDSNQHRIECVVILKRKERNLFKLKND